MKRDGSGAGKQGIITISGEEIDSKGNSELVLCNPTAKLPENGLCFFIIYRNIALGKYTPIYKSEIKRPEEGGHFKWN